MSAPRVVLIAITLAGCAQQYVANVRYIAGSLVAEKCDYDFAGRATNVCHTEVIDGEPEPWSPPPDPPQLAKAARAAAVPPAMRPAPSASDVRRALASRGVRRAVELCRASYARDVTSLAFTLTIAPTGELAVEPHGIAGVFAECAARALRTANLGAYDGTPVTFEEQLAL